MIIKSEKYQWRSLTDFVPFRKVMRSNLITCEDPHLIQVFKFGMIPLLAHEPLNITNARAEGNKSGHNDPGYNGCNAIFLKQAFLKPIQVQRCLMPADADYEWSNQNKPSFVFLQNKKQPFAFAGLYNH